MFTVHPEADMNAYTKDQWNPSSSCRDISFRTTGVNLMVGLEEKSGNIKVNRIHPLGTINVCAKFHPWSHVTSIVKNLSSPLDIILTNTNGQILYCEVWLFLSHTEIYV